MAKRKIIVLETATLSALDTICEAALKHSGIQVLGNVNAVRNAIKEEKIAVGELDDQNRTS